MFNYLMLHCFAIYLLWYSYLAGVMDSLNDSCQQYNVHCRVYAKVMYAELLPAYWVGRLIGVSPTNFASYFIDVQVRSLLCEVFILFTLYLLAFFEANYKSSKSYALILILFISPVHAVYSLVLVFLFDCTGYCTWKRGTFPNGK